LSLGFWHRHFFGLVTNKKKPKTGGQKRKTEAKQPEKKRKTASAEYQAAQEQIREKWLVSTVKQEESLARLQSIDFPSGWLSTRRNIWERSGTMNASHYLDFLQKYALYVLDNVFDNKEVQDTAMEMVRMFLLLVKKEHKKSEMPQLRQTVIKTLMKWEKVAPDMVKPIILHLLVHLVDDIERFGSVYNFWMFAPERMIGRCLFIRVAPFFRLAWSLYQTTVVTRNQFSKQYTQFSSFNFTGKYYCSTSLLHTYRVRTRIATFVDICALGVLHWKI